MKPARRLRRFFSTHRLPSAGGKIWLAISETHHLRNILRLKPGDPCLITDGAGSEAEARIENFSENGETLVRILERKTAAKNGVLISSAGFGIRVCQAMPQRRKMDDLVEKAQELGVSEIWPVETSRTVVKMSAEKSTVALMRWQKIAREAAKQSGSLALVKISAPRKWNQVLEEIPNAEKTALFHPDPKAQSFREWIKNLESEFVPSPLSSPRDAGQGEEGRKMINLLLGPEGGFTAGEIKQAVSNRKGIALINLGGNILKSDTAFLAVISALRLLFPKKP